MGRILIIDDDQAVRNATKMLLDASGFDVVAVEDGSSGIKAIEEGSFDVVIVDLFMPGMDGLKTTKALRQRQPSLPIIAISGSMFRGGARSPTPNFDTIAAEAGPVTTLHKPFRPQELLQAINNAIGTHQ